jgi:hypothetical protein
VTSINRRQGQTICILYPGYSFFSRPKILCCEFSVRRYIHLFLRTNTNLLKQGIRGFAHNGNPTGILPVDSVLLEKTKLSYDTPS